MFTQSGATLGDWGGWRVQTPDQTFYNSFGPNGTVSEGIGYGMIGSCYMSNRNNPVYDIKARSYFHGFLLYYKYYKNARGLMNWDINSDGSIADYNGATDGDLDAAFACFMMHRLYGSSGAVNYLAEGKAILAAIETYEFVSASASLGANLINNGDGWGPDVNLLAPDYIRFAYIPIFKYHTGDTRWDDIYAANHTFIRTYFTNVYSTGLIPDACTRTGTQDTTGWGGFTYGYNSIRMAWGYTLDYLWWGNTDSYNNQKKLADTSYSKASGNPQNAHANPNLTWTSDAGYANQTFVAGYGTAGLVQSSTAQWAGDVYTWVHNNGATENSYFGLWQGFLNLLVGSGEMTPTFGAIPSDPTTTSTSAKLLLQLL